MVWCWAYLCLSVSGLLAKSGKKPLDMIPSATAAEILPEKRNLRHRWVFLNSSRDSRLAH
jgi:hypothetical protein